MGNEKIMPLVNKFDSDLANNFKLLEDRCLLLGKICEEQQTALEMLSGNQGKMTIIINNTSLAIRLLSEKLKETEDKLHKIEHHADYEAPALSVKGD